MPLGKVISRMRGLSAEVRKGLGDQKDIVAGKAGASLERIAADGFDPNAIRREVSRAAEYVVALAGHALRPVSTLEDLKRVFTDFLTELPNQRWVLEYLEGEEFRESLFEGRDERESDAKKKKRCMVLLDLDRFGVINDVLGYPGGNQVLKAFADRLRTLLRDSDIVARYGGEEFMAILSGITLKLGDSYVESGACVMNGVLENLSLYFRVVDGEVEVFCGDELLGGARVVDMSSITEPDVHKAGAAVRALMRDGVVMRVTFSAGVSELSLEKIERDCSSEPTVEAVNEMSHYAKCNGRAGVAYEGPDGPVVYGKTLSET